MNRLIIKPSDFRVTMREKNILYSIYGKKYVDVLPKIYETLSNILNSSDVFSVMVYRSIDNRDYCQSALEEINKLFLALDESQNIELYSAITRLLFYDYIYYLLQSYIVSKEPALTNCMGVKDIKQCDFLIDRYHHYIDSLAVDIDPSSPTVDNKGCVIINKGDLFHGTTYSEQTIESIANSGLESGQLHGIVEDGETFCCVDFFKADKDSTPNDICSFGKQYTNGPYQIVFVINHENLEGSLAMFPDLTDYDAYNEKTEKGRKARELVNVCGLVLDHTNGAAILMGVPSSMISAIIINSAIENDSQKIEFLASHFPKAVIVSRTSGKVINSAVRNLVI